MTYHPTNNALTATTFIGALTGNADTATKLGTATVGSTTLPIYLNAGVPTALTQANLRISVFSTSAIGSTTEPVYIAANGVATAITQANLRIGVFGATAIGSTSQPVYIAANGVATAITGAIGNSTTGNASTATTAGALTVGRTFTINDFDGTNSQAAATAFTGSADYTIRLPATIKATITGTASGNLVPTSTYNLGTTSITFNRASAAQSLTGISIDGSAGSVSTSAENTGTTSRYILFANSVSGNQALKTDTGLTYHPTANALTVGSAAVN